VLKTQLSRAFPAFVRASQIIRLTALIATIGLTVGMAPAARAEVAAYVVFDASNGTVVEEKAATRLWHPASVTKLMTAYVAFHALRDGTLKLTSPVVYSDNARKEPPSKMGFKAGTILTLDNALKMMIVKSANDVAVAIAEAVGGSEPAFVTAMNAHAARLGMRDTRFTNPNGLPDKRQVTTARDMGLLAQALIREFPEYYHYFRIAAIQHGKRTLQSHNVLLRHYQGADGMKTGYICDAGLNLVATAKRGGRRYVVVVFGARNGYERAAVAAELLDKGFGRSRLFGASKTLAALPSGRGYGSPPSGYCRQGEKPKIEELLAQYGRGASGGTSGPALGYASANRIRPVLPGVAITTAKAKKKKKGKNDKEATISAEEVLTRLVGPPRGYVTVRVFTGGADDVSPRRHLSPIDGVNMAGSGRGVPLPEPHPVRMVSAPAASASPGGSLFAKAAGQSNVARPAALLPGAAMIATYPKMVGGVPVPQPRPR